MKNEIIKKEQSLYHIVHSKDSTECERFASAELQKYLYKSLNCPLPIFSDKCQSRGKEILIGDARGNNIGNLLKGMSKEAYIIKEVDKNIILSGNSPRAILYSVYRFLEEFVGFRCFASDCEKVDKIDILEIEEGFEMIQDFSFEYREAYFTDAFTADFASKNMLNSNLADLSNRRGGKTKWFNFHHSFSDLVNPNEYYDEHPEYFSLVDGVRIKEHAELCLSNPEVFEIALAKLKKWIIENPDCEIFSVAQDEWMGHFIKMACECEKCKEIDDENGSQSGSIITFVNKLLDAIRKDFPDKLIHTFAYQYSRKTPSKVIPDKNLIVRLCNIECSWAKSILEESNDNPGGRGDLFFQDLVNWSKITNRLYIWDYAVNFRNYLLPFPNLRTMEKNIELYRQYNVKGVLMQGNFSHGGKGYLDELKSYITAHLLRDDHKDLNYYIKEFCDNYYGINASKYIIDYINLWEDSVSGYDLWLYDDADHPMFSDEVISKAKNLIEKAFNSESDEIYIKRIEKLSLGLEYLELVRLELDYPNRDMLIDKFYQKLKKHEITEIFERTALSYSIDVMKRSRYCKERPNWYSLYYIMR